ncbi:MAG: type I DNA topoisomerase [Cyanobacteria bacterium J06592_8]
MSTLVIVESPTKARTISNFLPRDYRVEASMGHVRDLPPSADEIPEKYKGEKWAPLGVNVESDFEPIYVVPKDKKKVVKELKDALKVADELVLATDEDREGESISWHLLQLLQPKIPTKRMVFHEITQEAIQSALRNCRDLDEQLVHAQETRRILDRLYGYTLSPLLWKKIARGLSAGRVQSVAVRLLVHRERERRAFRQGSYWDLKALLEKDKTPFEAKLTTIDGTKVATGSDFDENTGKIAKGRKVVLLNEADAMQLKERLTDKPWTVSNIEERPTTRKPAPPFTTSTLQQESNRKLRLSARQTMQIAQGLYERGFITYMRTDSVHLSEQAIEAARTCVEEKYGKDYLSPKPRQYTTKSKGAQEAHEAIRPAGNRFRTPRDTDLGGNDLKLYDLIWKRTVACQMADSRQTNISVELKVENAGFRSSGKRIDFPGFLRAYVEGSDDPDAALENQEVLLPKLKKGDHPECQELEAVSHETQPPARFTEASLVKTLESEGVGRPSTYASVIGTIIDRGYAQLKGNALTPTFTAFAVTTLLEKHFPDLVDIHFTARMENTLDDIATGEANWLPYLKKFYSGDTGLETQVKEQESQIDAKVARTIELENLGGEADGVPYQVCIGKFGPYIQAQNPEKEDEVITASIPQDLTPADLTPELIQELLQQKTEGPEKLGLHPENGEAIFMLIGPYGPYVQLGEESEENKKPKRVSLPKGVEKDSVTLDMAVGLLSLPRLLGVHPETGAKVKAAIGRFGPYVVHDQGKEGKDYRSIKAPDDVLTITLDRALEMLAQPKASRGSRRSATPLRELGGHPEDNEPVNVYNGPYGHYVKHGKINASVPKEVAVEDVTLEQAVEWLKAKESSGTKSRKKTTTTKSGTTRKSSSTTKKSTGTTKKTTGTTKRSTSRKKASPES